MELRRSCKFVLPKEMYPFFLLVGKKISERTIYRNAMGSIDKKIVIKVTHFLIFNA